MKWNLTPLGPFDLGLTAWVLRRDPRNQIDRWDGRRFQRAMLIDARVIDVSVTQSGAVASPRLNIAAGPLRLTTSQLGSINANLDKLLGLQVDVRPFMAFAALHRPLNKLAARFVGLKPPRFPSVFEALVNAISCQQLSLRVGIGLMNHLARRFGRANEDESAFAFPSPADLLSASADDLRAIGYSYTKARNILELAKAAGSGHLDLEAIDHLDDEEAIAQLQQLGGVGRWTAQYVLLRGLRRLHVFPADDVGVANKLRNWLHLGERRLDYDSVNKAIRRFSTFKGYLYFYMLINHLDEIGALRAEASFAQQKG